MKHFLVFFKKMLQNNKKIEKECVLVTANSMNHQKHPTLSCPLSTPVSYRSNDCTAEEQDHVIQVSLTSRGSNIPFLVTMICLGCSSTGRDRIKAATSSAVFHLANWRKKQMKYIENHQKQMKYIENHQKQMKYTGNHQKQMKYTGNHQKQLIYSLINIYISGTPVCKITF